MSRLARLFSVVMLILALGCNLASVPLVPAATPAPTDTPVPIQKALTCNEIITAALEAVGPVCDATGRNEVCYGNRLVNAELYPGAQAVFERVGDLTALQNIRLISTTPWNEAQQTWGVALLKAQVNLPDSLPGENVTFLLYGGATMEGVSPRMEAVILNTGMGRATCKDAPVSAALVQAPVGSVVTMNINGANLIIGSTLHLTAVQNEQMSVSTINGTVIVDAMGKTEIVTGGAQVKMPLGAEGGLAVVGPPSEPEPFDLEVIEVAPLELLPETVEIPDPITAEPAAEASPTAIPTTEMPPTDTATPRPSATRPIITIPAPCFPRTDWIYRYTVARGDTLFSIASRVGISPALLQAGNCIPNANQIYAGQVLRVPVPPSVTDTPTLVPTNTFTPTGSPTATDTLTPTITHTPTFTPTVTSSPTLSPTPITPTVIVATLTPAPTLTSAPTFTPTLTP